ncbi:glycine-rich cell wall structural protein 1.0-like [Setaria italica]|uniref:glycine-rich cell wall structural protein 1.0-like n=1 Tax=Setaria italica TaxID=4555 RepID=UPI000350F52A|nr:glycine-rich cell wall structural protein 1.0-like [Setaria italica]
MSAYEVKAGNSSTCKFRSKACIPDCGPWYESTWEKRSKAPEGKGGSGCEKGSSPWPSMTTREWGLWIWIWSSVGWGRRHRAWWGGTDGGGVATQGRLRGGEEKEDDGLVEGKGRRRPVDGGGAVREGSGGGGAVREGSGGGASAEGAR